MPIGPGGLDPNGIWLYGEDDSEALASDLLNLGMQSVSDAISGGLGAILQIVRATSATAQSTTSTSFVDATGVSVTITPTSATSTILVISTVGITSAQTSAYIQLTNSSNTALSGAEELRVGTNSGSINSHVAPTAIGYDSPSTTSAITYKLRLKASTGDTTYIVGDLLTSQIYAIEVAG